MIRQLSGRVAVVTGGAGGIGAALAARFAAEGMRVVVADVNAAAAEAAAARLCGSGAEAIGIAADVSRRDGVEALARAVLDHFGAVHVVCNNAGVVLGGRVEELTDDEWRWVIDVDLWGAIHGVRVFLPILEAQGEGHIVSTSSTSGLGAPPFIGPYAVAKAGVIGLMETVRRELEARQSPIGASVLCPGPVRTALVDASEQLAPPAVARSATPEGEGFRRDSGSLLQRSGRDPAEVAELVVQALIANRFWIVTHDEWATVLRERVERMFGDGLLSGRPLAPPAPD